MLTKRQTEQIHRAVQRFARSVARTLPDGQAAVTILDSSPAQHGPGLLAFDLVVRLRVVSCQETAVQEGLFDEEDHETDDRDRNAPP